MRRPSLTKLVHTKKNNNLLWVAQCLGCMDCKIITDVIQNLFLAKYDSFCHFFRRKGILYNTKYNSNFSLKLTSSTNKFINLLLPLLVMLEASKVTVLQMYLLIKHSNILPLTCFYYIHVLQNYEKLCSVWIFYEN
jgi:hypothetical protein